MSARRSITSQMAELRDKGCTRVRVTNPKQVSEERAKAAYLGMRLGNAVSSSYKYPWLYITLGGKIPTNVAMAADRIAQSRYIMSSITRGRVATSNGTMRLYFDRDLPGGSDC